MAKIGMTAMSTASIATPKEKFAHLTFHLVFFSLSDWVQSAVEESAK